MAAEEAGEPIVTTQKPGPRLPVSRAGTAALEVVPQDPRFSTRWHQHDYPSPFARWHFHPEYEVHLIEEGVGNYIVGDAVGRFGAGQVVLTGPQLPHNWISDIAPDERIPGRDVVLQFHDAWIRSCQALMPELEALDQLLSNASRGIEFSGDTAVEAASLLRRTGQCRGAERVAHVFRLLHLLSAAPGRERRYLSNEWVPAQENPETQRTISRAIEYVFENLTGEVRLSTAARLSGMSVSTFSRYFKRASGQTFSDMVRKLRLVQACRLLERDLDSVAGVAGAVGYRNLSNFNRQFLREYGCTPSQYRKDKRLPGP
ncbi:AraC family transcriptional regulator [Zafaria sp. Z1313]|uniref:AraC family transcriptional regulator n=1 Tax=Zafaria sp. Z1313 TaxID=3423202 RepID=UPI003D3028B1